MSSMSTEGQAVGAGPGGAEASILLEAAQLHPEALSAFTRAYHGRHQPLDVLWWWANPLTAAPSGAVDPASVRAALAAAVYSRGASAQAASDLAQLERQLETDAEARERAIQDARPAFDAAVSADAAVAGSTDSAHVATTGYASPADTASARFTPSADAAPPASDDGAPGAPDLVAATVAAWRRRSFLWMASTIAATLLLLAGVGLVVVQQLNPQATPGFSLLGGATPSPSATPVDPNRGLTIFENPELAPSIPPANIDPYYQPDTLRLLGVADVDLTVYAVENRINEPCLLAVYTDGTQSATCVTREEFEAEGIELRITSLRVSSANDPAPNSAVGQDVVFWKSNGTYGVSSSPARASGAGQASNSGSLSGPSSSFVGGTPGATPATSP